MKKLLIPAMAALLSLSACSEDFEVSAPYKNITVVYGLLNPADTAHYIRIQKAFLDEHKNAADMAKTPDSSFYADLDVKVEEVSNSSGAVVSTILPSRVDLNLEGYPKEPGAFFTAPSYAWKFKRNLNPAYSYRLLVTNRQTGELISARTAIIANDPFNFRVPSFDQQSYTLAFANPLPNTPFRLNINRLPDSAAYFEGIIRFHYVDKNTITNQQTDRSVDWNFATVNRTSGSNFINLDVTTGSFFQFLASTMGIAPANTERYMDSVDMFVWAGTQELQQYRTVNQAQGGLTADQIRPFYTNIQGANALGLLAGRASRFRLNIPIAEHSLDSLKVSPVTRSLNIVGVSDH